MAMIYLRRIEGWLNERRMVQQREKGVEGGRVSRACGNII